ncbi:hypothetical protein DPV78_010940 [Talaromyces pinophilus]|nr:hypothetical protein DPV78_010940 [Talaromyces pinophilus]
MVSAVVNSIISGAFRGKSGADTFHHHIIQGVTKKIYLKYCQSSQVKPNLVSTDQGVKGFWIGSPRAKFVGIFFHGGGFAMDGTKSHIDLCLELQRSLDQNGIELAWFYSTYTLMPHATYPTQFCEAVETLNYILHDLRRDPSEVILAGDSAGANLCLAILSHMTHPATGAPRLIVQEPLKAIALISPWVSFDHNWPSVRRNEHKDIEATDATALWSRIYLDVNPTNYYTEAARAPEEWWKEAKVQHTLVLAGEDEILLDPITAWVSNFQKSNTETTFVIGEKECHIAPIIWPMFGDKHETHQVRALKDWLKARLL